MCARPGERASALTLYSGRSLLQNRTAPAAYAQRATIPRTASPGINDVSTASVPMVWMALMSKRLPYLFDLMHRVMKKIRVNIIASLVINLTAVVLSAMGILNPVTGALWHNFGSVFVVVNAALLLRVKDN